MTEIVASTFIAVLDFDWPEPQANLDKPFDLGNGVRLRRLPEWLRSERAIRTLSQHDQDALRRLASLALVVEFNKGDTPTDPDLETSPQERIRRTNLAMWLARPSAVAFDLLIEGDQYRDGEWVIRSYSKPPYLRAHKNDWETGMSGDDLAKARTINETFLNVPADSATWAAARAIWRALTEPWWEERYLLLWIALEAVFGPQDARGEVTHRISQRLAFFLEPDPVNAQALYHKATEGYSVRSRIVHGLRRQRLGTERALSLMADAEEFVRLALITILASPSYREIFSSKRKREAFLDGLVFLTRDKP